MVDSGIERLEVGDKDAVQEVFQEIRRSLSKYYRGFYRYSSEMDSLIYLGISVAISKCKHKTLTADRFMGYLSRYVRGSIVRYIMQASYLGSSTTSGKKEKRVAIEYCEYNTISWSYTCTPLLIQDFLSVLDNQEQVHIAECLLAGHSQLETAEILNLTKSTIGRKVERIRQHYESYVR